MKTTPLYTTPQAVIDFADDYYDKHRMIIDFPDALQKMEKAGMLSSDPLPVPEFNYSMPKEDFIQSYSQFPLEATRLYKSPEQADIIDESDIFPKGRDVFCIRHEKNIGPHYVYHNTYYAIAYVFKGKCRLNLTGTPSLLNPGDICIIPPGFQHSFVPFSDSFVLGIIVRSSSFNIVFNDFLEPNNDISDFFRDSVVYGKSDNFAIIRTNPNDDDLRYFIQSFAIECLVDNIYGNSCAISLLKIFLTQACRKYNSDITFYKPLFSRTRPDATALMHYIQSNYRSCDLKQTAEYFHYNESYLCRLIKTYFGKNFVQIVTEVRIEHAKKLLSNTEDKISDISLLCGFSSKDHFSRTFKKYEGISPADYRAKHAAEKA